MCQQTEQREAGRATALTHAIRTPCTDRAAATSAHTFVLLFYIQLIPWPRTVLALVHTCTWMHKNQRQFMSIQC